MFVTASFIINRFSFSRNAAIKGVALSHAHEAAPPEVLLVKGVLKICSKFTGELPCRSVISIKLQSSTSGGTASVWWNVP